VCGVRQVRLCVCVSYEERPVAVNVLERGVCGVGQVRLFVRVSYEECRVAVSLLERLGAWCCAGPSVCVCYTRNAE